MEKRGWLDRNSVGILRTLLIVSVCFGSAWIGGSVTGREARASVPDYMRNLSESTKAISDEMKTISRELKTTNRYLKEMEDSIERIQKEYTK